MALVATSMSRRRLLQSLGLGSAAALLAGPGALRVRPGLAQDAANGTVKKITLGLGTPALTLLPNAIVDETTQQQISNMFDPVLNYDPEKNYAVGDWLANLKNVDELTWEVKIVKDGIKFHNGEPVDASAIKAGIDYAQDPANKSHYLERYTQINGLTVVDPLTLQIKTSEPFPVLPIRLVSLYPVPPKYLQEKGAKYASENPVGSGPFKFTEWNRNEYLRMERNPDYWRNPVQVEAVEFRYIPEFSSRLSALLAGEIDIMKDVPVDSIETVNNGNEATAKEIESSRINYVALVNNREGSVMADKRIRQAVNYAVDVDAIIKGVFQGHATRMAGALSHLNPDVNTEIKPYQYDPDKAKALLKEAGVDSLDVTMDAPQGRYPMDTDAAQAIASYLGEVGINVKVQYNEWGTHLDKIVNRRTGDMFYLGWGPALDAQGTLQFLFTGDSTYSGYTNKEVEAKIAIASKTVDPQKRKQLWDEVQQMVYDDAGWLFLWQQHDIYGIANEIDWQPRPDEFLWMGSAKPKAGS